MEMVFSEFVSVTLLPLLVIVYTDSTGHSAHKSSKLLKNGLLIFGKMNAWKTCTVCLKCTDVFISITNHLLKFTIELAWRTLTTSYILSC